MDNFDWSHLNGLVEKKYQSSSALETERSLAIRREERLLLCVERAQLSLVGSPPGRRPLEGFPGVPSWEETPEKT